jgi:hypothetical protein
MSTTTADRFTLPDNARLAMSFVVNVEEGAEMSPAGLGVEFREREYNEVG